MPSSLRNFAALSASMGVETGPAAVDATRTPASRSSHRQAREFKAFWTPSLETDKRGADGCQRRGNARRAISPLTVPDGAGGGTRTNHPRDRTWTISACFRRRLTSRRGRRRPRRAWPLAAPSPRSGRAGRSPSSTRTGHGRSPPSTASRSPRPTSRSPAPRFAEQLGPGAAGPARRRAARRRDRHAARSPRPPRAPGSTRSRRSSRRLELARDRTLRNEYPARQGRSPPSPRRRCRRASTRNSPSSCPADEIHAATHPRARPRTRRRRSSPSSTTGGDFATIAKEKSIDPGSGAQRRRPRLRSSAA